MHGLPNKAKQRGFSLMELMVVVAIMAILFVPIALVAQTSINRAKIGKAQSDLNRISKAIYILEVDTGYMPNWELRQNCALGPVAGVDNEIIFVEGDLKFDQRSGMLQNFANVAGSPGPADGWNGPYLDEIPLDPWGTPYEYDGDYNCHDSQAEGCEGHDAVDATDDRVMYSRGPDKTLYTEDDILLYFCER